MANDEAISRDAILDQLRRMLKGSVFSTSERLSRFLRYTIEHAIDGKADQLKEYTIGAEVYDRKPPYHTSQNSIVRVEAARLRAKLKIYYEGEGKGDPIQIYYRLGSYVPVFRFRIVPASTPSGASVASTDGIPIFKVAVLPFADSSASRLSATFAQGFTDELVLKLMQTEGCRVVAASSPQQSEQALLEIPSLTKKLGVEVILRGTVREHQNRIRITCELVNTSGLVWSQKLEGTLDPDSIFELEEQMASAFMSRVAPQCSANHRLQEGLSAALLRFPELLAAEALLDQGDKLSTSNALGRFKEISNQVPDSARVWSGIVHCHYWLALSGEPFVSDRVAAAERTAMQALATDSQSATAHAAYGCALAMQHEWRRAEESFRHATNLGVYTPAYRLFGDLLTSLSRFEEAAQFLEFAQQIDPFSYRQKAAYSRLLYMSRRFDQVSALWSSPPKYGSLPIETLLHAAHSCVQLRRYEEVLHLASDLELRAHGSIVALGEIAELLALAGDRARAMNMVNSHKLLAESTPLSMVRRSLLLLALKDSAGAASCLRRAAECKEFELHWLSADPRFDSIRNDGFFSD